MERPVRFDSAGLSLRGTLHTPEGSAAPRPAVIICHGFGGNSTGADRQRLAQTLVQKGYVALRFDFRGCGASDGEPGRVICMEEVEDLGNAITFLQAQDKVDGERIGVIGGSLGGSVAIYAAAFDPRLKACAANGAIGDGERRFRYQYRDNDAWKCFLERLEEAKRHRERTGTSIMIDRFEIVHIPEHRRAGLSPGARMRFPAETATSMLAFKPEKVARRIAPRPLLLIHPRGDDVVPMSESECLAAAAGDPCELHIIDTDDHFSSTNPALLRITLDWLSRYLPT